MVEELSQDLTNQIAQIKLKQTNQFSPSLSLVTLQATSTHAHRDPHKSMQVDLLFELR